MNYAFNQTPDDYLRNVIAKYQVNYEEGAPVFNAAGVVLAYLRKWAGTSWLGDQFSGSYAKGTAIASCSDLDIFLSMNKGNTTLGSQYYDLANYLRNSGFGIRQQNVSINVSFNGCSIDVVPGWKHSGNTNDHSLFRRKAQSWTKTNIATHIQLVRGSGRLEEIKLCKIWRQIFGLDFPSFYLELVVIDALAGKQRGTIAANMAEVFTFLRDQLATSVYRDPANKENYVSDDLTVDEKKAISKAAELSLTATWQEVIK